MSTQLKSRVPWREKLEKGDPRIVDIPPRMEKTCGSGKMLIARPLDVDSLIRRIPRGKLATVAQIRESLARAFSVNTTCPLTTGIFIRIAAEAAEEDMRQGAKSIAPYWRVVQADGRLNDKFPGGAAAQARRLTEEGHAIEPGKGKTPRVKDFEKSLTKL